MPLISEDNKGIRADIFSKFAEEIQEKKRIKVTKAFQQF